MARFTLVSITLAKFIPIAIIKLEPKSTVVAITKLGKPEPSLLRVIKTLTHGLERPHWTKAPNDSHQWLWGVSTKLQSSSHSVGSFGYETPPSSAPNYLSVVNP